jgi:hypothetical protein
MTKANGLYHSLTGHRLVKRKLLISVVTKEPDVKANHIALTHGAQTRNAGVIHDRCPLKVVPSRLQNVINKFAGH